MNKFLKEKIIENEKKLLENYPEYKQSICQYIKKIETTRYDGVLYELIQSSFKNKSNQEFDYNKKGFKSSRQILNNNIDLLDLDDRPKLNTLKKGELLNSIEICSLASNYNNQVGMYFINSNNVIIKSTVEDNNRPYDDRWIIKDVILKYFMQNEKEDNLKTLIFSNTPNATIFNALMEGNAINIYTFINHNKRDPYEYVGIFHPCGLVNNNKAFLLYKDGCDSEIPYDNLDAQFIMTLLRDNKYPDFGTVNILTVQKRKTNILIDKHKKITKSKRNLIQQLKIDLEVALRGEDLVVHYEKNKLIKMGYPELANKVENITLKNSELGYDIKSFEVDKSGNIKEVFIKVKSSVSEKLDEFVLTKKEFDNLINEDMYKFYRVYDIYTDKPKFYEVIEPLNIIYNVVPNTYALSIKGE